MFKLSRFWLCRPARVHMAAFAFAFLCILFVPEPQLFADEGLPLPARKPAQIDQTAVVHYTFRDFGKAGLTASNARHIPVPAHKPKVEAASTSLSNEDAKLYKEIFVLQSAGKIKEADKLLHKVDNHILRGHVLYQRYMHPVAYTSSFKELYAWLDQYSDHPDANKIHGLARRKMPASFTGTLKTPKTEKPLVRVRDPLLSQKHRPTRTQFRQQEKTVGNLVRQGRFDSALKIVDELVTGQQISVTEQDILQADIAAGYLYAGSVDKALRLAKASAHRSKADVPLAGWIGGLSAWKAKRYGEAAELFETAARSPYASPWMKSAGAFWAGRSQAERGQNSEAKTLFEQAAQFQRTFYGLLAIRSLRQDFDFNWSTPDFSRQDMERLQTIPAAARAMALVETGQVHRAERELLRIQASDTGTRRSLLAYAQKAKLPALSMRLGGLVAAKDGQYYDTAFYPQGAWQPATGFEVDPALMHAIIRQESLFDDSAESPSGAKGLMQVMPETAAHVARNLKLDLGKDQYALFEPRINLAIGQSYLSELMSQSLVGEDLLALLVAYNGGPGNLARWKRKWADVDDPLLFIELIPLAETRAYVERVLANYWIYRLKERAPTPTLDRLAEQETARYAETSWGGLLNLASINR